MVPGRTECPPIVPIWVCYGYTFAIKWVWESHEHHNRNTA
jgi:hypothetical protein